jgi:hypothetical protein
MIKLLISLFLVFCFSNYGFAQNSASFWTVVNESQLKQVQSKAQLPKQRQFLLLDQKQLQLFLENVPERNYTIFSSTILDFPNAEGKMESFMIMESSVMSPELQQKFPSIRSYVGKSIENPSTRLRFSISKEKGLSSMALSDSGSVFIEPYDLTENTYMVYANSDEDEHDHNFVCLTESVSAKTPITDEDLELMKNANDGRLRTYRLALACTVEYAQFHGGTLSSVMAAMNTTMTRVNGVYERDLGVSMQMVDNESIIFLGPDVDSDPYTNDEPETMLSENQETIDANIGSANYDIGHVFSTGNGGVANLRSPCNNNTKARGVTGLSSPVGDQFDIDYVAHEFGHQFGANHTQNNDCERANPSVEPGSASTIMGYAGICPPNIQLNSDDYFHGESIKEIWSNISQGMSSSCGDVSITGNTPPTANAGSDFVIPISTPFILKGSATDPDSNDVLSYNWEQIDRTPSAMPPEPTSLRGPLFRSRPPSTSPDRFMPAFSSVLATQASSTWEVLPSVEREMNFLLTVRDNSILGGNTSSDEVTITTQKGEPFYVQTPPTWPPGSTQTLKWIVGNSNQPPINAESVTIYFSEDGSDFSTVLASGVPNSGTANINIPQVNSTADARLLVEANDHIFYNVTEAFSIGTTPDFMIHAKEVLKSVCNLNELTFDFDLVTSNGFSEQIDFIASGPNELNFSFTEVDSNSNFSLTVEGLSELEPGQYTIEAEAVSASVTKSVSLTIIIEDGACVSVANTFYETSITDVIISDGNTDVLRNLDTGKPSGYSDFTDLVADVVVNSEYEFTVNVNTDGNFKVRTFLWIDWNQNCSFDDPGEQYDLGDAIDVSRGATDNSPLAITVPANAVLGKTRMRISTKFANTVRTPPPSSCENDFDGEVEDYTINIKSSLNVDEVSLENLDIYPNPSQGKFTIELSTNSSSNIQLSIYDLRGRSLVNKHYDVFGKFQQELDVSHLASGIYLLKLTDGSKSFTKKLMLE